MPVDLIQNTGVAGLQGFVRSDHMHTGWVTGARGARSAVAVSSLTLLVSVSACGTLTQKGVHPPTSAITSTTTPSPSTTSAPFSSTGFLAQSVTFISDDDAWVLGALRCLTGWCTAVRHTTNRGRSWVDVPAPPTSIDGRPQGVSELRFADQSDGFAFDPALWVTHDSGTSWHQVSLPGPVLSLAAADREVYAVVSCPSYPSCTGPARLYRSPAGTDAWQPVVGVNLPSDTYSADLQLQGRSVYVIAAGAFIHSYDGTNFSEVPNPCPPPPPTPGYGLDSVALSSPTDLVVLCGDGAAAGSEAKQAYVSTDGGNRYEEIAVPPFSGDAGSIAAATPTTFVISAASGATFIYRTSSPDSTWTTAASFGDGGIGITDLGFTDATHGVFIHAGAGAVINQANGYGATPVPGGLGTLYLTDDAGATWYMVPIAA